MNGRYDWWVGGSGGAYVVVSVCGCAEGASGGRVDGMTGGWMGVVVECVWLVGVGGVAANGGLVDGMTGG